MRDILRRAYRRSQHERAIYRTLALAALDNLHEAQRIIDRLRQENSEMRELQARLARTVFRGE